MHYSEQKAVHGRSRGGLTGALDARLSLDGEVDKKPAKGGLKAAKQVSGGWRAKALKTDESSLRGSQRPDWLAEAGGFELAHQKSTSPLSPISSHSP